MSSAGARLQPSDSPVSQWAYEQRAGAGLYFQPNYIAPRQIELSVRMQQLDKATRRPTATHTRVSENGGRRAAQWRSVAESEKSGSVERGPGQVWKREALHA